jgi:type IV pilus assembly protein PilB
VSDSNDRYIDPVQAMLQEQQKAAENALPEDITDEANPDNQVVVHGEKVPTQDELSDSTDLVPIDKGTEVNKRQDSALSGVETEQKNRIPIGEVLIERGIISRDQLEIALKVQRDSEGAVMIGAVLVEMGFITESTLGAVLTENTDIQQFDPKTNIIDPNLIKQVPKDVAQRFSAVPTLLDGDKVLIATTDIYNVIAIDRIKRYFPKRFKMIPIHCSPADLSEIIDNYYDYELSIDGILREMEARNKDDIETINVEDGTYTNPTVRLIDALLIDAIRAGASDIHFEPEESFVRLRYRVDGKLYQVRSFHRDYWMSIVVRIKIISDMNITETRNPQDGRISLNVLGRQIDFRVATQPTIHGENIVMRILDKEKALLPMPALGFTEDNIKKLQLALKSPEGIIVVTGPTGSGKTTTLYSILSFINSVDINIMTLEDPVEYMLPMIRQANIREGTGMDFIGGVKSAMRQDPDVIFVGEVRDNDTATMALRAAMTGHQVFTSLHTNDAIGAIPRFVDIGVNPTMLSGSIIACVAQRLARRLCNECKVSGPATEEEIKVLRLDPENPPELFRHVGCDKCKGTGYKGRVAISEIILFDEELNELIANEASRAEMLRHLEKNNFKGLADDGTLKTIEGLLDLTELIRTINMTDRF